MSFSSAQKSRRRLCLYRKNKQPCWDTRNYEWQSPAGLLAILWSLAPPPWMPPLLWFPLSPNGRCQRIPLSALFWVCILSPGDFLYTLSLGCHLWTDNSEICHPARPLFWVPDLYTLKHCSSLGQGEAGEYPIGPLKLIIIKLSSNLWLFSVFLDWWITSIVHPVTKPTRGGNHFSLWITLYNWLNPCLLVIPYP